MYKEKVSKNILFYLAYGLLLFATMFSGIKVINDISIYIKYLSTILLVVFFSISYNWKIKKNDIYKIILIISALVSFIISKNNDLIILYFLIIISQFIEYKKIIKADFYFRTFFIIIVMLLYFLGVTNKFDILTIYNGKMFLRHSMGFTHPNIFGINLFIVCSDWIYLRYNKIKPFDYILLLIVSATIFLLTHSRTSCLCIILITLMTFINKKTNFKFINNNKFKKIIMLLPIAILIFYFVMISLIRTSNSVSDIFNKVLSDRIGLADRAIKKYGITPFGSEIPQYDVYKKSRGIIFIDNSYFTFLLNFGVVDLIELLIIIYEIIKKGYKNKNFFVISELFVFLIYGLSENILVSYYYNIIFLYLYAIDENELR